MTIRDYQEALVRAGYLPGPIDGRFGRQTAAAVRAFQADHGLEPDGIIGPMTSAALAEAIPHEAMVADPGNIPLVWLAEASHLLGLREGPGAVDNPTIIDWSKEVGVDAIYTHDDIAWCGLFVAHCIGSTLAAEPLPAHLLAARSWERFGIPLQEPARGAVMVFFREGRDSGKGHVGFYLGEDAEAYCILGGNQSDRVSVAWVSKARFLAARWPATFSPPLAGRTQLAHRDRELSVREA